MIAKIADKQRGGVMATQKPGAGIDLSFLKKNQTIEQKTQDEPPKNTQTPQSFAELSDAFKVMLLRDDVTVEKKVELIKLVPKDMLITTMANFESSDADKLLELFISYPRLLSYANANLVLSCWKQGLLHNQPMHDIFDHALLYSLSTKMQDKNSRDQFITDIGDAKLKEILKTATIIDLGKILPLLQERPEFYSHLPTHINILDIGHRLGLKGKMHEGNSSPLANISSHRRYKRFVAKNPQEMNSISPSLKFRLISDPTLTPASIVDNLTEHGSLESVAAEWPEHAMSFHFMRDKDQLHIIYVNRGQRHELAGDDDPAVMVFTLDNKEEAHQLIENLIDKLKTTDRSIISQCIQNDLMHHFKQRASETLAKSNQKVGNCSFANANISWHFKLASDMMSKDHTLSFPDAFEKTRKAYKTMRMEDRADAFCSLIMLKNAYGTSNDFHDALQQVMIKMFEKDIKKPERQTVSFLLNELKKQQPNELENLFNLVMSDKIIQNNELSMLPIKLKWAQEIYNLLPESNEKNASLAKLQKLLDAKNNTVIIHDYKDTIHHLKRQESHFKTDDNQESNELTNAYHILNLPSTAYDTEIRNKYKALALRHHPDKNLNNPSVHAEQFKAIDSAYKYIVASRKNIKSVSHDTDAPQPRSKLL